MISPLDYRYYIEDEEIFKKLKPYLSQEAFIKYQLKVEVALVKTMASIGICSDSIANEVENAIKKINLEDIFREEKEIEHDIRALVRIIKRNVSDEAEPYIHLFATSADIVDTANSLRFKDLTNNVILPELLDLEKKLIDLAKKEKNTIQIGRTHGKHAEPITFGFYLANYVDRIGKRIEIIKEKGNGLIGQMSGAVGASNAFSIIADEYGISPEEFEKKFLDKLQLKPALCSFQIVQPEPITDFIFSIISCFSVLANFSDDMRHLMRSEIEEIDVISMEKKKRIGSSTMPHKVNPWHFEHVKSMWKAFMPRIITHLMDQISEHQRDLTNSASSRFISELIAAFIHSTIRMRRAIEKIEVKRDNMKRNLEMSKNYIVAEPLYTILAVNKFPNAYDYVKKLVSKSRESNVNLMDIFWKDDEMRLADRLNDRQKEILKNPEKYVGVSERKTEEICSYWEGRLLLLKKEQKDKESI